MKYRPKHVIEYILMRCVAFTVSHLPYRITLSIAWLLAFIAFHLFHFRRSETLRRMRSVFGDKYTPREYNKLLWLVTRNTAFCFIEFLISNKGIKWFDSIFDYEEGVKTIKKHADTGKGAIIAIPHMGAWDLAGRALLLRGIPMLSIIGGQRNPLIIGYFEKMRVKQGFHTIFRSRPGILKTIARGLKTGKFLVILPDVRMRTPGIELPFLGGTANLGPGTASFARITNAPIFCAIMHRVGWTHHTVKLLPVIRPDMSLDKQTDIKRMMSIIIEAFDREIREAPEQWFWFNKRWVLDPIDNDQLQQEKDKTND